MEVDVTIKNVPEGAEEKVKELAAVAVERFLLAPLQPPQTEVTKFQSDFNKFLEDNSLDKKYSKK